MGLNCCEICEVAVWCNQQLSGQRTDAPGIKWCACEYECASDYIKARDAGFP